MVFSKCLKTNVNHLSKNELTLAQQPQTTTIKEEEIIESQQVEEEVQDQQKKHKNKLNTTPTLCLTNIKKTLQTHIVLSFLISSAYSQTNSTPKKFDPITIAIPIAMIALVIGAIILVRLCVGNAKYQKPLPTMQMVTVT
ncbi:hypothetical protein AB837_00303 [bacterium AB1]|nr:hypothetical protein AB837_00303 [bacterium AB1]